MSIGYDELWIPGLDGWSHVRQVYRGDEKIGRVRRWREHGDDLTQERFTAERKKGAFYVPIEGTHATFEEALERVIFCGVAH